MKLGSQLGPVFDGMIRARRPDIDVVALAPGVPASIDADVTAMIALPFCKAGQVEPARPDGWPFGLKWIQLVSVGMDLYPSWLYVGPLVSCARGATSESLAEFALAAILSEAKSMPDIWIHDAADWKVRGIKMVRNTTLGLVGFGGIGQALAPMAQALGMRVMAIRRTGAAYPDGVTAAASLTELFAQSDHVVLAAPFTPETVGMISRDVLACAKPGQHLINIARGILIDDDALIAALDDGRIARATLDVTHPEPLPAGHPFYSHPRIHVSPHLAVMTNDVAQALLDKLMVNLTHLERGTEPEDLVDTERGY